MTESATSASGESVPSGSAIIPDSCRDEFCWRRSVVVGVSVYLATLIPVVLGVVAGFELLKPGRAIPYGGDSLLLRFAAWDGGQFMSIMDQGYQYDPARMSNSVLFPGYPLLGRMVQWITGFSAAASLLVVSHFCALSALIVYHRLIQFRFGNDRVADICVATLAAIPTTFFWRMAYSESPFVLLQVLFLYGIQRKWSCEKLAIVVGLASSLRLVGIAMLVPLVMEFAVRRTASGNRLDVATFGRLSFCVMLGVSGLLGFMLFQWIRFGDPFVFVRGQAAFCLRQPVSGVEHWYRLVTLEPVWGTYLSSSDGFWHRHSPAPGPWLNLQFWNPIWFCITCGLIFYGWFHRQLTDAESALGAGLLLISYVGRAEEFCMGSQGRYASVVIPAAMLLGIQLARRLWIFSVGLAVASISLMTLYSAMFGAWYFFL
jgi:hypothetical protein